MASTLTTFANLQRTIEPINPLPAPARAYFDNIVRSREAETWDCEADLLVAAQLAQTFVTIDTMRAVIEEHGYTQLSKGGNDVARPEIAMLQMALSSVTTLTRALGLSASQRGAAGLTQKSRNAADRQARSVIERVQNDDVYSLLA